MTIPKQVLKRRYKAAKYERKRLKLLMKLIKKQLNPKHYGLPEHRTTD